MNSGGIRQGRTKDKYSKKISKMLARKVLIFKLKSTRETDKSQLN